MVNLKKNSVTMHEIKIKMKMLIIPIKLYSTQLVIYLDSGLAAWTLKVFLDHIYSKIKEFNYICSVS